MLIFRALVPLWYLSFDFFKFISKCDKTPRSEDYMSGQSRCYKVFITVLLFTVAVKIFITIRSDYNLHINYKEGVQI